MSEDGLPARSSRRPVAAVDARCLQRRGIGVSVVLDAIMADLKADGWDLVLVTDNAGHAAQMRAEGEGGGAEVAYIRPATWLWWEQVSVSRWLFRHRPDVWLAPRNYGVPLVHPRGTRTALVVQDLIPLVLPGTYLRPRPMWAAMYLASSAAALVAADLVLAISDRTAEDVRRFSRRRATVVYPPVAQPLSEPRPEAPTERPYVLYNGGYDARKNVPAMLAGFARFRASAPGAGARLVMLGDRPEIARSLLEEGGLSDVSEVTGFVGDKDKWAYLANAAAVVYPSSYEGFGLVVAEAFAAGAPVVSGAGGSLREVGGEAAIFVDPTSASSIADGLAAAFDPGTRERAVSAGYRQLEALRQRSGGYALTLRSLLRRAS